MVVCLFIPFFGPISYYILGVNRVRTRAKAYRESRGLIGFERPERYSAISLKNIDALGPLATVGATISGHYLLPGNKVLPLQDAGKAYDAMLAAIDQAVHRVYLASYIFESDKTGQRFIDALVAAKKRNVEVKILIDGVGQYYSYPTATRLMKRAGLDVRLFLPFRLIPPALHFNLRNHRKILVADSTVAFTGGMNIGSRHVARADGKQKMTDIHFQLNGPIVYELCNAFCNDWFFTTGEPIDAGNLQASPTGSATCRMILDDPGENMDRLSMVINGVVSAASKKIDIMTPYFLPSRELIAALQSARSRGVRVRIVLPDENNLPFVNWATTNMLWELLMWDVEVYYQPAPFCHSKLLLVDDDYVLMGSANLDPRSLRLNFELGIEIFDRQLASHIDQHFCDTCQVARPVTLQEVDGRNLPRRVRDSVAWLFSPYL
ncbi:MAG: cardiolipin synthase [Gammaproteobacteria bacterium]|nr:cardiolipin synthase [Gammaproteobacteria bacterium]